MEVGLIRRVDIDQEMQQSYLDYAMSVIVARALPDAREFAACYLAAFRDQFLHIQGDYRKRRRAFDTLFKHSRYDPGGSFAYRWECVLRRLDQTNPYALVEAIRQRVGEMRRQVPALDLHYDGQAVAVDDVHAGVAELREAAGRVGSPPLPRNPRCPPPSR